MSSNNQNKLSEPVFITESIRAFNKDEHFYPPEYEGHFDGLMVTAEEIRARVRQLAELLHGDYRGTRPLLICTLKGACPFYTHLSDALQDLRQGYDMEFVRASSYVGTESTGTVQLVGELKVESLKNRRVLVIEDILDTGTTLANLVPMLQEQGKPANIEVCTLLDKRLESMEKKYKAKYVGFSIPEKFIIGYGLDYNELYRDLKDIFVISQKGIDFNASQLYENISG